MGHRVLRRQRLSRVPGSCPCGRLAHRGTGAPLSDPVAQRHRAHPQGHARAGGAGEHASVHARALGALLDLRPQWLAQGFRPAPCGLVSPRWASTDSELAFCWLLETPAASVSATANRLRPIWRTRSVAGRPPLRPMAPSTSCFRTGSAVRALFGPAVLHHPASAPFARAHLVDEDLAVDFSEVTTPNDRVAVIATMPLTDNEQWTRAGTRRAGGVPQRRPGTRANPPASKKKSKFRSVFGSGTPTMPADRKFAGRP